MLHYTPSGAALNRGVFLILVVTWIATILTVAWMGAAVIASPAHRTATVFNTSLSPVSAWLRQSGKATVMRGPIASALGFENKDLAVLERGFRRGNERLTHVSSVIAAPGYKDVIFLALVDENTGDATVWRATSAGDLVSSVRFSDGQVSKIPNEEAQALFLSEKRNQLRQVQADSFRTRPAPPKRSPQRPVPIETKAGQPLPKEWRQTALPSEWVLFLTHPWLLPAVAFILALAVFNPHRR